MLGQRRHFVYLGLRRRWRIARVLLSTQYAYIARVQGFEIALWALFGRAALDHARAIWKWALGGGPVAWG